MGQDKYQQDGDPRTSGPGFAVTVHEDALEDPLRQRTPRTVFVNSMSDLSGRVAILVAAFPQVKAYSWLSPRLRHVSGTAVTGSLCSGT